MASSSRLMTLSSGYAPPSSIARSRESSSCVAAATAMASLSPGYPGNRVGCAKLRITQQYPSLSREGSFGVNQRSSSPIFHFCPCLQAKRKTRDGGNVSQEEQNEIDEDVLVGLNEISTEALKAMLSENDKEVARVRAKVDYIAEYLVQEEQLEAARFMLILRGMLDHEVVPQKDELKGSYKKAFDKIAAVIEDSGWVLKQEGADVGGVEMVDDELLPPVLNTQY